jgi:ATP-binding cassette subfamily F protein 3
LRSLLGSFLFSGDDVDKKVAVLSGGEKARLALARMLLRPSNLLLLDEPTNHLDLQSREVLEDALDDYAGTMLVISHDRYFINRVATSIAEVGRGGAEIFPGDYDTFLDRRSAAVPEAAAPDPGSAGDRRRERERERDARRFEADERNRRYRERKAVEAELAPLESAIEALEGRLRELAAWLADPQVLRDGARAREAGKERAEAESRLAELYRRWEGIASRLDG